MAENYYLYIKILPDARIQINSSDGVFSSLATVETIDEYKDYCEEKSEFWLNSQLGNFSKCTKSHRQKISDKWKKAKAFKPGKYDYYFNLADKSMIFKQEVARIAKSIGIKDYTLVINRNKLK